jgi:alanine racemase
MLRALARVDTGAIERNCARLTAAVAPARLCAVVKANGYGHGAVPAARAALEGGARQLAVATAAEAAELRAAGIEGPLLIMGALSAWTPELVAASGDAPLHVKLDTGMGRLGTRDAELAAALAEAAGDRLVGLMTHFATSDDDPEFARNQLATFLEWADPLRRDGVLLHASNSAGALGIPEARLDMVRCGIAVYGMDPFHEDPAVHGLEPALRLESYVAAVKPIDPGQSAGYGRRFVAEEEAWLATVPIGYADGVRRALTNNAEVLIGGRRRPLVGTVSMDNITVRVDSGVSVEDEVVLLGRQGSERILAEEWARRLQTINYEVTCAISARVPREHS